MSSANSKGLPFFSPAWAAAAVAELAAGPDEVARAKKIQKFWDWIEKAAEHVDCELGLAVSDLDGGRPNCLLLTLEKGKCTGHRLVPAAEAQRTATYLLEGSLADWREIMGGYDMGRSIMYRKLRLAAGDVLVFFRSAYYWTESLACLQRVPTAF